MFQLSDQQAANYNTVKPKFDGYFAVRKSFIYERAVFNKSFHLPNEPVEDFIFALHCLVEHCNCGALKEEMIRDRSVVGLAIVGSADVALWAVVQIFVEHWGG